MRNLASIGFLALAFALATACATNPPPAEPPPAPPPAPAPPTEEVPVLLTTLLASPASPTSLTLRIDNPSAAPAKFSRVHTPFEGIQHGFLTVRAADGTEVLYEGPMVKRGPPTPEEDVVVEPGASMLTTFDLLPAWPLVTGDYTVWFSGGPMSGLPASEPVTLRVP